MRRNSVLLALVTLLCLATSLRSALGAYPPNYHNFKSCLYSYVLDGHYRITFSDHTDTQENQILNVSYDDSKNECMTNEKPGTLFMNFPTNDNYMTSMSLEFQISPLPSDGYWQITKATLQITPTNTGLFPTTTIELKAQNGIYASVKNSFSCSSLVLTNLEPTKDGPHFKLTLNRFQLQPFKEMDLTIFAPSRDCSVWLTLPQIMGFLLILFIIVTALFGVYMLLELGNQTSDLRFSKQGGMLMNQAQLDATKSD